MSQRPRGVKKKGSGDLSGIIIARNEPELNHNDLNHCLAHTPTKIILNEYKRLAELVVRRADEEDCEDVALYPTCLADNFAPEVAGWFNTDPVTGEFRGEDLSLLKYLTMPIDSNSVCFNLSASHELDNYNLPITLSENIDPILRWIMENSALDQDGKAISMNANFICYRDVISDIMKLPYQRFAHLRLLAIRIKDTIYLCEVMTDWHRQDHENLFKSPAHLKSSKQGLKFQQYMLSDEPEKMPDLNQPFIRDKHDTCVMLRANVGNHNLLYASKTKGLPNAESILDLSTADLFDLKTSFAGDYKSHQLLNWWTTSVAGKISRVIVGLRGRDGIVRRIDTIKLPCMLRRAQEKFEVASSHGHFHKSQQWDPKRRGDFNNPRSNNNWRSPNKDETEVETVPQSAVPGTSGDSEPACSNDQQGNKVTSMKLDRMCFGFLNEFLDFVWQTANSSDDGPDVVYQFDWNPENKSQVRACKFSNDDSLTLRFIPSWFTDWINK